MINELLHFLDHSPTAFGAVASIQELLRKEGFEELKRQKVEKGKKYYITRNGSSVIAFKTGTDLSDPSLHITASHTDCPSMKLKPNPLIVTDEGVKLNVEKYGGMLKRGWFDRPLSLAGRVTLNENGKVYTKNFIDEEPFCIIPSMAPHLDRELEDKPIDLLKDMAPVVSLNKDFDFEAYLSSKTGQNKEDILGFDLYLYPLQKGYTWGSEKEFFTVGHIDNLECAWTSLQAFLKGNNDHNINVYVSFDNEEVGSSTIQGADSDFLELTLKKICDDLSLNYSELLDQGFLMSCDNAHGIHPNHPDLYDEHNAPKLNEGVVIKYNASQSYVTDSLSAALFKKLLNEHKVPYQVYANKTGIRGGGTLGNISNTHVSLLSVDIGLAQWAMHSPVETAGSKDVKHMIDALTCFYEAHLHHNEDGSYSI